MNAKTLFAAVIVVLAVMTVGGSGLSADDKGTPMDRREQCLTDCNQAYGGLEWIRPPQDQFHGWATCVQRCERVFWDRFDKETGGDK
jgi:hypothetical protein